MSIRELTNGGYARGGIVEAMIEALRDGAPLTANEIGLRIQANPHTIRRNLIRYPRYFEQITRSRPQLWKLADVDPDPTPVSRMVSVMIQYGPATEITLIGLPPEVTAVTYGGVPLHRHEDGTTWSSQ